MKRFAAVITALVLGFNVHSQVSINAEDARKHIGEVVSLCGKIFSAKYLQNVNKQPTLLNLGGNYPNQLVTIAIFEADRKNFPVNPEDFYTNQEVCVTGKLIEYKGSPEIVVQTPDQIKVQLPTASQAKPVIKKDEPAKAKEEPAVKKEIPSTSGSKSNSEEFEVKLTADVNLRAGPSPAFAVVVPLKAGSIVGVIRSNNGWSYVVVKSGAPSAVNGYIKNSVLK